MADVKPLAADTLAWCCDEAELGFETSESLEPLDGCIGQERATEAIGLALAIRQHGYNIYALGPEGIGKHTTVQRLLEESAATRPAPHDLCYVTDFRTPHKPKRLLLPAGIGKSLHQEMEKLATDILDAVKNAFENEEYRNRRQAIDEEIKEAQERLVSEVEEEAQSMEVALIRAPSGFAFAPMREGKVISAEEFQALDTETRKQIEEKVDHLQKRLRDRLSDMPALLREGRDRVRSLNDATAAFAVDFLVRAIHQKFDVYPEVKAYIDAVRGDIVDKVEILLAGLQAEGPNPPAADHPILRRYFVNLMVDNSEAGSAPVIVEDDPTFDRLFGRIEHRSEMGALVTDTSMIRAGSLHRANGGYLVLDARKVLTMPMAYEGLKRALTAEHIRMQPPSQMMGLMSTSTLEPEPVELDVKIVIVGERELYYLLAANDPEFTRLFKVAADFDEIISRTAESAHLVARMLAGVTKRDGLRSLTACGTARLLEEAARRAGDQEKLSIDIDQLQDILREADYKSRQNGAVRIDRGAILAAVDARTRRLGRIRERSQEQIEQGTVSIATEGASVGQINGLAVLQIGAFAFGRPSRITARVRIGSGQVIDIERESKLGGPLHAKGVLILSSFLASRYSPDTPLSLRASLVFEQSYGGVDGDSASSTELYALLSTLSDTPIKQSFAVTGSVDQFGNVQAIGGANEKIEGFFDLCSARGLTGDQGVLIPQSNVRHLMLHERVREAVDAGKFRIFAVSHIDEGIELLTGEPAGRPQAGGRFPPGSLNARVRDRLMDFAEKRRSFGKENGGEDGHASPDNEAGEE